MNNIGDVDLGSPLDAILSIDLLQESKSFEELAYHVDILTTSQRAHRLKRAVPINTKIPKIKETKFNNDPVIPSRGLEPFE